MRLYSSLANKHSAKKQQDNAEYAAQQTRSKFDQVTDKGLFLFLHVWSGRLNSYLLAVPISFRLLKRFRIRTRSLVGRILHQLIQAGDVFLKFSGFMKA
jgi:hypothetical protein